MLTISEHSLEDDKKLRNEKKQLASLAQPQPSQPSTQTPPKPSPLQLDPEPMSAFIFEVSALTSKTNKTAESKS